MPSLRGTASSRGQIEGKMPSLRGIASSDGWSEGAPPSNWAVEGKEQRSYTQQFPSQRRSERPARPSASSLSP